LGSNDVLFLNPDVKAIHFLVILGFEGFD
jgi:hypothetical protein